MKIPSGYRKYAFSAAMVVALAASLSAFVIAYRQGIVLAAQTAALSRFHLHYALSLQDDMGVIDWAKSLEKQEPVLAFQARVNGKVIAEGGNRNYLPVSPREGIQYVFPATWLYYGREPLSAPGSGGFEELILVCRDATGAFPLALVVLFACTLTALLIRAAGAAKDAVPPPAVIPPALEKNPQPSSPPPSPLEGEFADPDRAFLFLDKQFIIRKASPRAVLLMDRPLENLQDAHLLDTTHLDIEAAVARALEIVRAGLAH